METVQKQFCMVSHNPGLNLVHIHLILLTSDSYKPILVFRFGFDQAEQFHTFCEL